MNTIRKLAITAISACCVGCAIEQPVKTYSGPPLSTDAEAQITHEQIDPAQEFFGFTCIDGASLDAFFRGYGNDSRFPQSLRLQPGFHYLGVVYFNSHFNEKENTLWLQAEAGHEYRLKKQIDGYSIRIWIEDAATSTEVGGLQGQESSQHALVRRCRVHPLHPGL
jgi:hypothetical protein